MELRTGVTKVKGEHVGGVDRISKGKLSHLNLSYLKDLVLYLNSVMLNDISASSMHSTLM